jgi:hypothetical protein
MFCGCGTTGDDNNTTTSSSTCGNDLGMLSGDNPVITLEGDTEIEIPLGTEEILANDRFCAYDPQDGELSQYVVRNNNIDFSRVGQYEVTYTVEDNDGNRDTKTRTVTIVDTNNNSSDADPYGDPYNNDSSIDNPNADGGFDLGQQIGSNTDGDFDLGQQIGSSTGGSDIDNFKTWYYNVCGKNFNETKYNETTRSYNDTISCSGVGLDSIDLSVLSVFSTINGLDLSNNQLAYIDFSQLGLNESTNNTKILKSLNLKNNILSTENFNLFRPLHYLKDIDKLYIKGNNFNYTCDDLYKLRTDKKLFHNGNLDIDREREQNCPSLQNK